MPEKYKTNGFDPVTTDMVMVLAMDPNLQAVAATSGCVLKRWPTYAGMWIDTDEFSPSDTDPLPFHDKVEVMIHEITHALGFASNYYDKYYLSYTSS